MVGVLGCHNAALRASCGQQVARYARLCNSRWGIPWGSPACRHASQHSQQLPADRWKSIRLGSARPRAQRGLHCQIRACSGSPTDVQQPSSSDTFVVTTPLYYVNAAPHLGGAYSTMCADIVARYQRLQGRRVRFVTGTDEHGEKIAIAAAKAGLQPQEHCDGIVAEYKALWQQLDISYDSFIRTTDAKHEALVAAVLERAWVNGDIYKSDYEGYYCVDCEEYKDEGDMDEHHNCPIHRRLCTNRKEENYFFRLSRYQKEIEELLAGDETFMLPAARRNEVLGWVTSGLRDFSISRSAVQWGIKIPRDPSQTVYVWFDALIGYMSALVPDGQECSIEAVLAGGWPADVHIIGKDILRFHAVYWPGMLLSAGLPLPRRVFGHGFLTAGGFKMGKALGNVIDPKERSSESRVLVGAYGSDAVRYFFAKEVEFGRDGDFSEERFRDIVNANLANSIGNLLNRTLGLIKKFCGGAVPGDAAGIPEDHPLRSIVSAQAPIAEAAYEQMKFNAVGAAILAISSRGNLYMEETTPWAAFKGSDEQKAAAAADLLAVLEASRIMALMLAPITPQLSHRIYSQLGFTDAQYQAATWRDTRWGMLEASRSLPPPQPVFQRLEGDFVITVPEVVLSA